MVVLDWWVEVFGAPFVERPARPGFRKRTDGACSWIPFPKALGLSGPSMAAATFTAVRATARWNPNAPLHWKIYCAWRIWRHVRNRSSIMQMWGGLQPLGSDGPSPSDQ